MAKRAKYCKKDGTPVPRCTQIIDLIGFNKRILMMWARKVAMAGGDPLKTKKQAADIGTLTHKMIECHIAHSEVPSGVLSKYNLDAITTAVTGFEQYLAWESEVKPFCRGVGRGPQVTRHEIEVAMHLKSTHDNELDEE